jgi:NADPH-dependent 2,4-dienoyl-CoA reductase/sulfur reductase-like enzyme
VIIGSGPAGITAAEALRAADRTLEITVLSAEPYPPYSPPALADHFLTGRTEPLYWKGPDVCQRLSIEERRDARVVAVAPGAHQVSLADGTRLPYDRLLLASGSRLYAPIPGNELAGVHNFKSLRAAEALLGQVRRGEAREALIVGAGFIGVEIALLLADLGVGVTVVELRDRVMPGMLDQETAEIVGAALRARGVRLRLKTEVTAFEGEERAEGVRLASGERVSAAVYVAATGVKPTIDYLAGSRVATGWGVQVDAQLRTNLPDLFAAGDVAETADLLNGRRYVHAIFPNAVAQGRVAAVNLLGGGATYAGAESMNSLKHLGVPVMAVGAAEGEAEVRWRRGDVLRKVFLTNGRVVGFRLAGDISGGGVYHALMVRRDDVRRYGRRLAEPGFGVGRLVWAAIAPVA